MGSRDGGFTTDRGRGREKGKSVVGRVIGKKGGVSGNLKKRLTIPIQRRSIFFSWAEVGRAWGRVWGLRDG